MPLLESLQAFLWGGTGYCCLVAWQYREYLDSRHSLPKRLTSRANWLSHLAMAVAAGITADATMALLPMAVPVQLALFVGVSTPRLIGIIESRFAELLFSLLDRFVGFLVNKTKGQDQLEEAKGQNRLES